MLRGESAAEAVRRGRMFIAKQMPTADNEEIRKALQVVRLAGIQIGHAMPEDF